MDEDFNIRNYVDNGLTNDMRIQANFTQINRMVFLLRKPYADLFGGTLADVLKDAGGLLPAAHEKKLLTSEQLYIIGGAAMQCLRLLEENGLAAAKLRDFYCSDLRSGNEKLFAQLQAIDAAGVNVTFLHQSSSQKEAATELFKQGLLDPQPKGIGDMTEYDMFTVSAAADVRRYQLIRKAKSAGILSSNTRGESDKPNDRACDRENYPENPCQPHEAYFCSTVPGSDPPECTAASDIWVEP